MKKIVLATQNRHKFKEIREAFKDTLFEILPAFQFPNIQEVVEDGKNLEENSLKKAKAILEATGLPAMADDTGLFVDALNGEPGIYAARFAGEGCTYEDNVRKLLTLMKGVAAGSRKAVFKTVITLLFPGQEPVFVEGEAKGTITDLPRGNRGFGYDPVFQPEGSSKVFAEMEVEEKNKISHRGKAIQKAVEFLKVSPS